MTEFLAASNSVAQRPPPIATRTSRKVHPELSSANLKVHARAPGAPLKAERLGSDASIASTQRLGSDASISTQRLGSDASIASTPTLFETSPSSSFRNADDEMSVCPSEDVPSEEATPTQPTQPTQPQPSQSARAWDRLYFARALRVSPPAGRRSPSSAEH
jgi:hypothetical protein